MRSQIDKNILICRVDDAFAEVIDTKTIIDEPNQQIMLHIFGRIRYKNREDRARLFKRLIAGGWEKSKIRSDDVFKTVYITIDPEGDE